MTRLSRAYLDSEDDNVLNVWTQLFHLLLQLLAEHRELDLGEHGHGLASLLVHNLQQLRN